MKLFLPSTEKQPLLFFQTFLTKEGLPVYEKHFYKQEINPSQTTNRSQGYIEYFKDYYKDDESPRTRIYFIENLKELLNSQAITTLKLLKERKLQKEFDEVFENGFVLKQLAEIKLLTKNTRLLPYQDTVQRVLASLEKEISLLLYPDVKKELPNKVERPSSEHNPFFGNKSKTTVVRLKRLYDELLNIGLIDEEEVKEDAFVKVFTISKPHKAPEKIFFRGNNYEAVYFLSELSPFFDNLSPVQISKSKAFVTKGDKIITENLVNSYNSRLRKRDKSPYKKIQEAIIKAMPPVH